MSTWVYTVLISFGKALLISVSILLVSCCLRFFYRFWTKRMGCHDASEDLSESCKYEMELQTASEMHHTTSPHSSRQDAGSELELPPSPGANSNCPPYNGKWLYPGRRRCDELSVSDSYSGTWPTLNATPDGEETTDADFTSMAGETTTMCSVLTGNDEDRETESTHASHFQSSPMMDVATSGSPPPVPKRKPSSSVPDFQDYQGYREVVKLPTPTRPRHDRGTELFLAQYYKSLNHESDNS